jgi:hypothetical protein
LPRRFALRNDKEIRATTGSCPYIWGQTPGLLSMTLVGQAATLQFQMIIVWIRSFRRNDNKEVKVVRFIAAYLLKWNMTARLLGELKVKLPEAVLVNVTAFLLIIS